MRIISGIVAVPLLFFIVIKSGIILKVSIGILTLIAIHEFFNAFRQIHIMPSKTIGIFSVVFLFFITLKSVKIELVLMWFFLCIAWTLIHNLFKKKFNILSSSITVIGIYYIVFLMYHIVFIANHQKYSHLIWLVFISAWATDTFAYFTGYFLGSRKLCPTISPKKTVEGSIGGILGSILVSTLYAYYFAHGILLHCIIIGLLGSIMGQLGDLTASSIKRYVGIKDYGKIMPGHGGILDRFDSVLFTAPVVYYYIILFLK